jgi:hypothetical protein
MSRASQSRRCHWLRPRAQRAPAIAGSFLDPKPPRAHSALIPNSLMSGHHFSIWAFWNAPSAFGVCCSHGKISYPTLASRAGIAGSAGITANSFRLITAFRKKPGRNSRLCLIAEVPPALQDLVAGQIDLLFMNLDALPLVRQSAYGDVNNSEIGAKSFPRDEVWGEPLRVRRAAFVLPGTWPVSEEPSRNRRRGRGVCCQPTRDEARRSQRIRYGKSNMETASR